MTIPSRSRESGFTLIEVVISLALFALISMAGIALVDAVIRVEERTSGRLERLGQLQRTMFLLTRDLEQISSGSLEQVDDGIRFNRHSGSVFGGDLPIAYALRGDSLVRVVGGEGEAGTAQRLMGDVAAANWTFLFPGRGWQSQLPERQGEQPAEQPAAVAVDIALAPGGTLSGSLRRVVELPTPPQPVGILP